MKIERSKRSFLALASLGLMGLVGMMGCVAGQSKTDDALLTGVLTRRGGQIESWLGMRAQDGKLWRLEPANTEVAGQLNQLMQQNVQVKGEVIDSAMTPPLFRVREVRAL